MTNQSFSNTGALATFIFRLDRLRMLWWLVGLTFFTLIVPAALANLYSSDQERQAVAETMTNPAMTAMVGPGDLDNYTVAAMTAHQMLLMTAVIAGLMGILLIMRHTRGDEEDGKLELIQALPTGRMAYLHAAVLVQLLLAVVLALVIGFGLAALNIDSVTVAGSLLYGALLGASAFFFAGVAAVFAQLSANTRSATGMSIAVLLGAYLFRAVTDVVNDDLSWLSPFGWVTKAEVYTSNQWHLLLIMIGAALLLFVAAYYLNAIRDLQRGFLPERTGKRTASRLLLHPLGLALRLQRTGLIAWAAGMAVLGVSYGSVLEDMETFFASNEMIQQMLAPEEDLTLAEQFLPTLFVVIAIVAVIPPVMAMNKLRSEERHERLEHLLGRAVSRHQLFGAYLTFALFNGALMMFLATLGLWAAGDASMDEGLSFTTIISSGMVFFPAAFVMIGLAAFLIGFAPKLLTGVWLYILYTFFVLYLGNLLDLHDWYGYITPFGHIPEAPAETITALPLITLSVIAAVLCALGFAGFRRRDID
ncbi:ABC transporter permease [Salisediminibacterium halotolerans]|uniref:ABC transporter permease n=1 Tax=Salisediminibacterium halotolerans TaxID=517425 RepID=UPI000EB5514E|nr:ABC transporter permease subunit [Salisediminibacterium halotolerans]RLJ73148.1 ABC-2 type transport system permease protein [Actinophytocola xinjiangensis]RPE86570.1 ABC-2 type transport system permease protein [Salisediminibacterium halotolerans]TWG33945.1 ABC-2 type transport system permease protein [Salisediminibacterium halotolerans]GEL06648.1 ABC transporter permease [Salisediminibacterium halotolerans]